MAITGSPVALPRGGAPQPDRAALVDGLQVQVDGAAAPARRERGMHRFNALPEPGGVAATMSWASSWPP